MGSYCVDLTSCYSIIVRKFILTSVSSDIDVIIHARKSLLFDGSNTWIKKKGGLFDVSMGPYDGAEVCELVGTHML